MKVVWSPRAVQRVEEIRDYILRDSPQAARRWVHSIVSAVESLQEFADRGRVVPELGVEHVRELVQGNYRIIYRVGGEAVFILTVRHGRRRFDPDELDP